MSTTAALSASAAASSAAAQAAADRAEKAQCRVLFVGYEDSHATIAQKQAYAQCVYKVYPDDSDKLPDWMVWVLLAAAVTGFVVGAIKGAEEDAFFSFVFGFIGMVLSALAAFIVLYVIGLIGTGVAQVVS